MKKLTTSVLIVALTSSFALVSAQNSPKKDTVVKEKQIEEVLITGAFGIRKSQEAQTSAQQVIKAEQLTQAGNPDPVLALQGKVGGVQIKQTNTSVDGTNSIIIRGRRSITGGNEALVVIDNVITTALALQQLPPDVIESINVIKGAQGSALYGPQGVNGVVVVTTKRGNKNGRMTVSFNSNIDFENVAFLPERQDKYGQGWAGDRIAVENGAWGPAFNDPAWAGQLLPYGIPLYDYNNDGQIDVNPDDSELTDDSPASIFSKFGRFGKNNVKDFFQTGTIYNNTVSVNVGGENSYLLMSLNNVQREFVVQNDKLNRTSVLLKAGTKFNKWSFDGSLNYFRKKTSQTDPYLYHNLLQSSADIPITMWSNHRDTAYGWNMYYQNPYWAIDHDRRDNITNFMNTTGSVGYKVNNNIDVLYRANLQYTTSEQKEHNDGFHNVLLDNAGVSPVTSSIYQSQYNRTDYYGDFLVNLHYDITEDLGFKANIGHNYQYFRATQNSAGGTGILTPGIYAIWNLAQPTAPITLDNNTYAANKHAVFANLDFDYKGYLFLNATARNEWNSVLAKGNRSYFYPSVGLSFVPTKAFNFGGNTFNYMRIFGNITKTANATAVGAYSIRDLTSVPTGYPMNGVISFIPNQTPTDGSIKPEKVIRKEIGLGLGFFKDRITINGSVYQDDTEDLITKRTAAPSSGLVSRLVNIGKMVNKGVDVDVTIQPIKSKDFNWTIGGSFSKWNTNITKVTDDADEVSLGGYTNGWGLYAVKDEGFVLKTTAYQRDDQGRIIINQANGNPLYTTALQSFGKIDPDYILNFNTNFNYKGFQLSAVFEYKKGGKFFSGTKQGFTFSGQLVESAEFDRTQGGFVMPNSVYQDSNGNFVANTSIKTGGNDYNSVTNYYAQTYGLIGENYILDATSFRVRELALSYSFPADMIKGAGLTGLTLGVHGRNLFTKFAKNNNGYSDPDTSFATTKSNNVNLATDVQGIVSDSQYPSLKTYGFSVSVNF